MDPWQVGDGRKAFRCSKATAAHNFSTAATDQVSEAVRAKQAAICFGSAGSSVWLFV